MPAHIFVVDETNFSICVKHGLAGIPKSGKSASINDGLISRMTIINKNDLVLFYIKGKKELHGEFRALEKGFYDETLVWESENDQIFPFRIRLENTRYRFRNAIKLSDIYDLRDNGLIWSFALTRPTGTNAIFSISNYEYNELHNLFLKKNPIYSEPDQIREPYPYFEQNLLEQISSDENGYPKYEYSIMAILLDSLSQGRYKDLFGEYTDYLSYVPTSFDREMDILLITENNFHLPIAYNIIEVKRDEFNAKGLKQILQYEDWFLKKKVNGDINMVRTTAIAKFYSDDVVDYVKKRMEYEGKEVVLLEYRLIDKRLVLNKKQI